MSFLTRSKANISEASFGFHSGADDKTKRLATATHMPNSFGDSLEEFRQGLRQQLSEKLTVSSKYSVASPSNQKAQPVGLKDRFATTLLTNQRDNHKKAEFSHPERGTSPISGPISAKPSEKKYDFVRELAKKFEDKSPKRGQNKEVEQFSSFGTRSKTPTPAPAELSSSFVGSLGTRDKSPLRSYALTIETKTPKGNRASFLEEKFTSKTPQEKRENFVKILDRTPTSKVQPQPQSSTGLTGDLTKSHSGFIQNLNQLRGSRAALQTQSPERKQELVSTPKNHCASLKTLSGFVSESFKRKEKETERSVDKMLTKKPSVSNGSSEIKPSGERSPLGNRQSSSKLFGGESTTKLYGGVQDFFSATQEKGSYNRFFK